MPSNNASRTHLNILMIGAHPDDCELKAGGSAILWSNMGHRVESVAMTGGDNGHPTMSGGALHQRRSEEARRAAKALGIAGSRVLDYHGGELLPGLDARREVVRLIRETRADVVISHRSTDYHPDHRYTATLVQDAAYMVTVPYFLPSVPALERNPVFLFFQDSFTRPVPFRPDIALDIDDVFEQKLDALECHASQMYEWTPFMMSRTAGRPEDVPSEPKARRKWLAHAWFPEAPSEDVQSCLRRMHQRSDVRYAEAFEVCEYGRPFPKSEFQELVPALSDVAKNQARGGNA